MANALSRRYKSHFVGSRIPVYGPGDMDAINRMRSLQGRVNRLAERQALAKTRASEAAAEAAETKAWEETEKTFATPEFYAQWEKNRLLDRETRAIADLDRRIRDIARRARRNVPIGAEAPGAGTGDPRDYTMGQATFKDPNTGETVTRGTGRPKYVGPGVIADPNTRAELEELRREREMRISRISGGKVKPAQPGKGMEFQTGPTGEREQVETDETTRKRQEKEAKGKKPEKRQPNHREKRWLKKRESLLDAYDKNPDEFAGDTSRVRRAERDLDKYDAMSDDEKNRMFAAPRDDESKDPDWMEKGTIEKDEEGREVFVHPSGLRQAVGEGDPAWWADMPENDKMFDIAQIITGERPDVSPAISNQIREMYAELEGEAMTEPEKVREIARRLTEMIQGGEIPNWLMFDSMPEQPEGEAADMMDWRKFLP